MWVVDNQTNFAAEGNWTRDERGAEFWLVIARTAFEVHEDGVQRLAEEQTPVQRTPVFAGHPLTSGLLTDSDFVLSKTGTDVFVEGSAWAPEGRAVERVQVRLKLADIDKRLNVIGERRIYEGAVGLGLSAPYPFVSIPVVWERAYGGWDRSNGSETWLEENPAGRGFARSIKALIDSPAPNIEYPDFPYCGPQTGRPAGLGPVAHHWKPRARFAGTYDKKWEKSRDPLWPADFDRRYFRSAPEDQQTKTPLMGYEQVSVGGMVPDGGVWSFVLPRLSFDFITRFKDGTEDRRAPHIHTLWLYPEKRRFELVYHSALEIPPGREEKLVSTTVRLRRRIGVPEAMRRSGVWTSDSEALV